jgi:hypothetical protein
LLHIKSIDIFLYKLSQTWNGLTEKSQSGHSLRDGGSTCQTSRLLKSCKCTEHGGNQEWYF